MPLYAAWAPSISRPINVTLPEPELMVMPTPDAGPVIADHPLPFMVTPVVMVSGPYLPGSSAATMPLAPTTVYACAKVAHGCAMVHGLVSTPVDETKERVSVPFWARAGATAIMALTVSASAAAPTIVVRVIGMSPWELPERADCTRRQVYLMGAGLLAGLSR